MLKQNANLLTALTIGELIWLKQLIKELDFSEKV